MRLFYDWVIVGAAMVITCVGYGAMFSRGVFLQPIPDPFLGLSTRSVLDLRK